MARGRVSGVWLSGFLAFAILSPGEVRAQKLPELPGVNITLPNIIDVTITLPTIIDKGAPIVVLPALTVPGVTVLDTSGLPPILNLPAGDNLLLINLPGISIVGPNLPALAGAGNSVLGLLLNQVSGVNQLLANTTGLNLLGPIEQIIGGLITGDGPAANLPAGDPNDAVSVVPLPLSNLWMWNAVVLGTGNHGGFNYKASFGDSVISGSTLPIHSSDWSMMPGILIDVSSPLGLSRGTLHVGVSGGLSESDLEIRGDSALRDLGITDAGSAHLRAWSLGGFALLTRRAWYAGVAAGGTWGEADTENSVIGAKSSYDGSSVTSTLFAGTIVPLSQTPRLDMRGTLGYHRTQGDAHEDSLGVAYGEHVLDYLYGSVSGRLFSVLRAGSYTLRPYLQAGVSHRFYYSNDLTIQDVDFSFDDADTSLFGAGGMDVDINDRLQLSAGVRYDSSPDYDYLSGRFGILLKLN